MLSRLFNFKPSAKPFTQIVANLTLPLEEARRRANILVVDDDVNAFPVNLLRAEGYNIQQWEKLTSIRNLEEGQYHIIILDIYNICSEDVSENGGLGVLEHLKRTNPAQIVIAYSGKKFDLSHEKFWRIADDYFTKPIDMLAAKGRIDSLLKDRFNAQYYWDGLMGFLQEKGVGRDAITNLDNKLGQAVLNKEQVSEADIRGTLSAGKDIIATAWIITQVIMLLAK